MVGVTPPEFFGADPAAAPDVYVPMHANLLLDWQPYGFRRGYLDPIYDWVVPMARLRPGVSSRRHRRRWRRRSSDGRVHRRQ